jgi:hypothetical protein
VKVSFTGGGNWSTRRKSPTCPKSPQFTPGFGGVGTPVSTTCKTYLHDITELLLNVMLNTIILVLIQDQKTLYIIAKNDIMLYISPCSRFELTTSVVIGTNCISSCKSNYHKLTAATAPSLSVLE